MDLIFVKGVCGFVRDVTSTNDSWKTFASVMAASVVSNMLRNPVMFEEWPHYEGTCRFLSRLWFCLPRDLVTSLLSSA